MKPIVLDVVISFVPEGGIALDFRDVMQEVNSSTPSYAVIATALVGIIAEFVPWAKVFKIGKKVFTSIRRTFRIFEGIGAFAGTVGRSINRGLKIKLDGDDIILHGRLNPNQISIDGDIYSISNRVLSYNYSGFGGNIYSDASKTTTLIGKWDGQLENIWNSGAARQGDNVGGLNVLGDGPFNPDPMRTWNETNKPWLLRAMEQGDNFRATANPIDASNLFYNNVNNVNFSSFGEVTKYMTSFSENSQQFRDLGFYGKEVFTFINSGYTFDHINHLFTR